jgi:hypothetical protein
MTAQQLVLDHATLRVGQWVSLPNEVGQWQIESVDPDHKIGPIVRVEQAGIYFRTAPARQVVPVDDEHPPVGTAWIDEAGDVWRLTGWNTYSMITELPEVTPQYKGMSASGWFFVSDELPDSATEIYRPTAE